MKPIYLLIPTLLAALSAHADPLYHWKDAQGHANYSDQPPPPSVKNAVQKSFKGNFIEGGESYELKQAREKFPVTLYVTACGLPCDQAKLLLERRGIPYTAKDPESSPEDKAAMQKLTGHTHVPVLAIGTDKVDGFEEGQWNAALDRAGYPKSSGTAKKTGAAKEAASAPESSTGTPAPKAAPETPNPKTPAAARRY